MSVHRRQYLPGYFLPQVADSGTAGTIITIALVEGSTVLGQIVYNQPQTDYSLSAVFPVYIVAPTAGSHTYTLKASTASGTLTVNAGSANPSVNDAGPAFLLVKAI